MDRGLRERIKEEADNHCVICGRWCSHTGSPHHVVKVSEQKLLVNCKKNIMWLCLECHRETEDNGKFQQGLQRALQDRYFKLFIQGKHYTVNEIAEIVQAPVKDIEKAMQKGFLKWEFVDRMPKALGLDIIRFLMGDRLRTGSEKK
jgi:hypothetical protein